jgi:hypothetical protein
VANAPFADRANASTEKHLPTARCVSCNLSNGFDIDRAMLLLAFNKLPPLLHDANAFDAARDR